MDKSSREVNVGAGDAGIAEVVGQYPEPRRPGSVTLALRMVRGRVGRGRAYLVMPAGDKVPVDIVGIAQIGFSDPAAVSSGLIHVLARREHISVVEPGTMLVQANHPEGDPEDGPLT